MRSSRGWMTDTLDSSADFDEPHVGGEGEVDDPGEVRGAVRLSSFSLPICSATMPKLSSEAREPVTAPRIVSPTASAVKRTTGQTRARAPVRKRVWRFRAQRCGFSASQGTTRCAQRETHGTRIARSAALISPS